MFMPVPFMRSMGVGGVLVPIVSIAASATFLPALLAVMGRGVNRLRVIPRRVLERRAAQDVTGGWHRFAMAIMRRPCLWGGLAAAVLIALALAATDLHLTGGDNRGIPITTEAARGLKIMEDTLGPGALAPQQVVIDTHRPERRLRPGGRRRAAPARRASCAATPRSQPDTVLAPALVPRAVARQANLVDDAGRVAQIRAAGRSDAGEDPAVDLVHRIRDRYMPAARLPGVGRRPAHRRARLRRRLHRQELQRVPVARARGARDLLPAAAARLPLGLPAAEGGDHEPAVGEPRPTGC